MIKYIYTDILRILRHFPWALLIGIPLSLGAVGIVNTVRGKRGREKFPVLPATLFGSYLSAILLITFLSRESGNRVGADWQLFSTWGINARNNAYVVENILLFVPYGFFSCQTFRGLRRFARCTLFGMAVSLCIESLQLVTGRGFFQIDDILMNTVGTMIGCLIFKLFFGRRKG